MKIKLKKIYATGLLSATWIIFVPDALAATSMKEALDKLIKNNPQISGDKASAKAREHLITKAQSGYLPKIDASVSAGYENTRSKFWASNLGSASNGKAHKFRSNPAINVVQNVFDGFKTTAQVEKARADFIQGEKKVDETMELLAFRAANAYIDVRRFQRLLTEAKRNLKAHQEIAGKVEELIKGGKASTADRFTLQARMATAANAIADIQGDLDTAIAQYINLVGEHPYDLASAKIKDEFIPKCLDDALSVGLSNNKTVVLARARLDVSLAEMKNRQGAYYPSFNIEAGANRAKNNSGRKGHTDVYNVLGVVRYNLYNGGADMASSNEIAELIAEQRFRLDSDTRTAEEDIRKSWAQYKSSEASLKEVNKSIKALEQEKDAFKKQYELGTRTLIDVLGAENEYFLARGSRVTTEASIDIAQARLLVSMGVFLERYGFGRNSPKIHSDENRTDLKDTHYSNTSCATKMMGKKDSFMKNTASIETVPTTESDSTPSNSLGETPMTLDSEKEESNSSSWFTSLFSSGNKPENTEVTPAAATEETSTTEATSFLSETAQTTTAEPSTSSSEEETGTSGWFTSIFSTGTTTDSSEATLTNATEETSTTDTSSFVSETAQTTSTESTASSTGEETGSSGWFTSLFSTGTTTDSSEAALTNATEETSTADTSSFVSETAQTTSAESETSSTEGETGISGWSTSLFSSKTESTATELVTANTREEESSTGNWFTSLFSTPNPTEEASEFTTDATDITEGRLIRIGE